VTSTIHHAPAPATFAALGISEDLTEILAKAGISRPFLIQELTIPDALAGRDVCGKAKTGSGKTLAFGLPMIERMRPARPGEPLGLVIVPTRELAAQVDEALSPLAAARSHNVLAVYGGASMGAQIQALRSGVEIVVATPGRLIDLMERKAISLGSVETLVVDEADEMADMGFLPQLQVIMRGVRGPHQTMLFSATLDHRVEILVRNYMDDPAYHEVETTTTTVETSEHRFLEVHHMDKPRLVARIARSARRTLVFVRTKHACDRVARDLRELGVEAKAIHGDLPQYKRERALERFTDGSTPVLVATNVAARGLHVDGVDVVIHFDPPEDATTYLHRSGRTARAGDSGLVVTFVEWDQMDAVRRIQREAGLLQPLTKMFSNDDRLDDLSAWAPEVPAAEEPRAGQTARTSGRARRRRRML
jgi:superfamily II DNA/RNA helicase